MGRSIDELEKKAERSEREYNKLLLLQTDSGHNYGHWTLTLYVIAWYDRKRLTYALKRQQR